MLRRVISAAALAACAGTYTFAATERATFILANGDRKSGTVVFHAESRENLINNQLSLGTDDGQEMTFPVEQVAVIDFTGTWAARGEGGPTAFTRVWVDQTAAELQELPTDHNNHLLVLRDDTSQQGHLVNLVGGDTIRWRNQAGKEQQYAIRDVRRIYLNPESARMVFNYITKTIRLRADKQWTETGLIVGTDQLASFQVSGQIQFARGANNTTGPDGSEAFRRPNYPVPSAPVGALIGRVGNSAPFEIGSQTQPLQMPTHGALYVGINDDDYDDNSGFFAVVITTPRSEKPCFSIVTGMTSC